LPVVSDRLFAQRKQQLVELRPPKHSELEDLHRAIAQFAIHHPTAQPLEQDLKVFLGWTDNSTIEQPDLDLNWIQTIAETGNSSDGHQFEKLVRKSLIKIGFSNSRNHSKASLDPEATGGAGGIDFFCDAPYFVVGECKATKSEKVPSKTPGQLIQLGKNHLQDDYDPCVKIISAAGELTSDAELTATNHQMNVIKPETLQRLVELKATHPGVINLIDLKSCLESTPFGRRHIVETVKQLTQQNTNKTQFEVIEIRAHYNAKFAERDGSYFDNDIAVHELLIELSSPLAGYLGRLRGTSMPSDRFYFLRELPNPILADPETSQ
jgi:hypothetical protein